MPGSLESRIGLMEREAAGMVQRIDDISRTIDRLMPHGETLVELRGLINGVHADIKSLGKDLEECRKAVNVETQQRQEAEKERRTDRRDDRKLLWTIVGGLGVAIITALGGILAAGVPG